LLVDRSGALWVGGLFRGPSIVDPIGTRFHYLAGNPGGESVRAMLEDATGHWWIGTDGGGLFRADIHGDGWTEITAFRDSMPPGPMMLRAMAFAPADAGHAWIATSRGLASLDLSTSAVTPVAVPGFPGISLRSIARGPDGRLWLGTQAMGLLMFDVQANRAVAIAPRDPVAVHAIAVDRRGRVWAGTSDGLQVYEPLRGRVRFLRHSADDAHSIVGNLVRAIHESSDGTLWIGTHSGLSRVRESGDTIRFDHPLAVALGTRPVPVVFSIAESPPGLLWLGTDAGVMRFDPIHAQVRTYGMRDGLQDPEFNGGAAMRLRDGRLALGGVRGINVFDPRQMRDSQYMPPVRLLSARSGATAANAGAIAWAPTQIDVPADAGMLRMRVGALDFADVGGIRYRYRLDGFDPDWIDNGTQTEVTYTRLPPGNYTFRAQATNRDGVWNPDELRVPVHIAAPPWRNPIAIAAYVLALVGLVAALAWMFVQRRRRERAHVGQLRDREERLKLALWASGELFWDYDLARRELRSMRTQEGDHALPDIQIRNDVEERHEIHEDDLPRVLERLKRTCAARRRCSSPNTACAVCAAHGRGCAPAAAWSNAARTVARCAWPGPRATSPAAAPPSASAASPAKSCAAWPRRWRCSTATSSSCRSTPRSAASAATATPRSSASRRACSTARSTIRSSIARCARNSSATGAGPARCGSSARTAKSSCAGSRAARCSMRWDSAAITWRCSPTSPTRSAPSRNCVTWPTTTR
jgi:hypothetical protein